MTSSMKQFSEFGYVSSIKEPWQIALIVLAFLIIIVMSAGGNGIVIWIVLAHRRMRSVTNYFLVNLSVSDILSIFHIIPNVYYAVNNEWIFGTYYCKFSQFFTAFGVCMSVLTFIGIAGERYLAIIYPLRPRAKPVSILTVIGLIWMISVISGLPGIFCAAATVEVFGNQTKKVCDFTWETHWTQIYEIILLVVQYIIPLTFLVCTYIPICIRLWSHQPVGENLFGQGESIRSKRKIVIMMVVIVIIFKICWLPYQLFFIILLANPHLHSRSSTQFAFITCYWLAMSNCIYNPIIYCAMNKRFRQGFRGVLRCCPFINFQDGGANNQLRASYNARFSVNHERGSRINNGCYTRSSVDVLVAKQHNIQDTRIN